MTVGQLIEELEKFPKKTEVYVCREMEFLSQEITRIYAEVDEEERADIIIETKLIALEGESDV